MPQFENDTMAALKRAASTIISLREAGRDDEAAQLEKLITESMAQLSTPEEDETSQRMNELKKTTEMIGEHITTNCMKDGHVDKEEVRSCEAFFNKCKPM